MRRLTGFAESRGNLLRFPILRMTKGSEPQEYPKEKKKGDLSDQSAMHRQFVKLLSVWYAIFYPLGDWASGDNIPVTVSGLESPRRKERVFLRSGGDCYNTRLVSDFPVQRR